MKIEFQKLWDDGGYGKDNKLENSLKYVIDTARKSGVPDEVIELGIMEIFLEAATGRQFSTTVCSCGCGIDNSGTDVTHAMLRRVLEMEAQRVRIFKEKLEKRFNAAVEAYVGWKEGKPKSKTVLGNALNLFGRI